MLGYETMQILWEHASSDSDRQSEILGTLHRRRVGLIDAISGFS